MYELKNHENVNALELLSGGYLMSGSENQKYTIWEQNLGGARSSNSAPHSIAITRIKQTALNKVIVAGSSTSIYFYPINADFSLGSFTPSTSYLTVRCTDMVMVNISTIWVSSNSPDIYSWNVVNNGYIKSKDTGSSNIESLESLSKNKNLILVF